MNPSCLGSNATLEEAAADHTNLAHKTDKVSAISLSVDELTPFCSKAYQSAVGGHPVTVICFALRCGGRSPGRSAHAPQSRSLDHGHARGFADTWSIGSV